MPSSLIEAISDQLTASGTAPVNLDQHQVAALAEVLATVPDRRRASGRRYRLSFLLAAALTAVLAGARTISAITRHTHNADDSHLIALGAQVPHCRPAGTTFTRAFTVLDGDDVDRICGTWLAAVLAHCDTETIRPDDNQLIIAAADGKTVRGARTASQRGPHLVAIYRPDAACVLGQAHAGAKRDEINTLRRLLNQTDITGLTITADALHAQRATATTIVANGGHYLLFVKANQASLLGQLQRAFRHRGAPTAETTDTAHGRRERRLVSTATPRALDFPHAAQAIRITRYRTIGTRTTRETVYAITDLTPAQAGPAQLGQAARAHWSIEALHHIRDVTFAEDAGHTRTGSTPRLLASLRNLAIALLKLTGWTNLAAATDHMRDHRNHTLTLLGIKP